MSLPERIRRLAAARARLPRPTPSADGEREAEGGCGVVGLSCSVPVRGAHIIQPSEQMHNRGNGKGGGIAACGLDPAQMKVTPDQLDNDYMLQIAYLDPPARGPVETAHVLPCLDVHQAYAIPTLDDPREAGLEVRPPVVWRYFVRVKPDVLDDFILQHQLRGLDRSVAEDEFLYQNSFRLNHSFYASLGEKRAFVLSHAKNLIVLKAVGYAEQAARWYRLEDLRAHVWIAHQRYPTKGKVWHPAGAHPFIGMHEALVHNGDFANYHSITEYLAQRNLYPLFLTDTEVSVLLFDLWIRTYGYPLEYVIEAMAPTTERDFALLPAAKRRIYRAIQTTHIHGSPDGPWFFIIARNDPATREPQLIGITDTSMLRPQVFALYQGEVEIGLIASEKQAIDATLGSLHAEDRRFCPVADRYWNARGGSHTDGGSFTFTVTRGEGGTRLVAQDKFGGVVDGGPGAPTRRDGRGSAIDGDISEAWKHLPDAAAAYESLVPEVGAADFAGFQRLVERLVTHGMRDETTFRFCLELLTLLHDRRYPTQAKKRSWVVAELDAGLRRLLDSSPWPRLNDPGMEPPQAGAGLALVVDATEYPPEGPNSFSAALVAAYRSGWRHIVGYNLRGHRFAGAGLGLESRDACIHLYGVAGDYAGSGMDGAALHLHGSGQDQLAQILRRGKLVVHGDVGQTFMYGAKGGDVFVLGSAAGRPLINAVGRPRVVINGTCLDYLAESFMAGDPLHGGGFVVLNGIGFDDSGFLADFDSPYPGGNLFSLASGGAIYVRDPERKLEESQLNGGVFAALSTADWDLIRPYLEENERLFGIPVGRLLTHAGAERSPEQVYRKVHAARVGALGVTYEGE